MRDAAGAELSRSNRANAPVGWARKLTPDWPAKDVGGVRRFGAMFAAAAISFAGAAFGSPPAALAQSPAAVPPANLAQAPPAVPPANLAQSAPVPTPAPVASPPAVSINPAVSMNDADKRIAADLLFKRLLLKPDDLAGGFQYAQRETELGDCRSSIGAL